MISFVALDLSDDQYVDFCVNNDDINYLHFKDFQLADFAKSILIRVIIVYRIAGNFHGFCGSDAIRKSFLHENGCVPLCIISDRW